MTPIATLDIATWQPDATDVATEQLAHELEAGGVLIFPRLPFVLAPGEARFLDPRWSNGKAKNISLDAGSIKGGKGSPRDLVALAHMVERFAEQASGLVGRLFPRYAPYLTRARTSYRPLPATGRNVSWRKDDARLHIDAFPSRPSRGERILRVFNNVSAQRIDRVWRVGERFEPMARTLLPRVRRMRRGESELLALLRVTKTPRSEYDHLMLGLHDAAKADPDYQRSCAQTEVRFSPGTTWICFSDQVMHAASSGQYMLEQTINLPAKALYEPASSPLAVLERLTDRRLV